MALIKVVLPAMGEGIFEATITQWLVNEGDHVNEDDPLVEIATDKVDSEVPAPVSGILKECKIKAGSVARIGQEIAVIEDESNPLLNNDDTIKLSQVDEVKSDRVQPHYFESDLKKPALPYRLSNGIFLSPLVRRIAEKEGVSIDKLLLLQGSGLNNRITKDDILNLIHPGIQVKNEVNSITSSLQNPGLSEVVELSRMRKIIAKRMVESKQTAPHVTTFHEVDVTQMVNWRNRVKDHFFKKHGQKLTFTPVFFETIAIALKDYPTINVSLIDEKLHIKKEINIGMATALPDGNLIVPVIKAADTLSLNGLAAKINDLAKRARAKALKPDETTQGTFTITNVGAFGNLTGTPIINQPESAILAIGTIKKRPAVIETPHGDLIGIRHLMILSLSYDHRIIDGALGGMFLKRIADILENFDENRPI